MKAKGETFCSWVKSARTVGPSSWFQNLVFEPELILDGSRDRKKHSVDDNRLVNL